MTLTRKQFALLNIARARLQLAEDDYRAVLRSYGGVASARDLDGRGFATVMERFRQLGFASDWRTRNLGNRPGMATAAQVAMIRGLWRDYAGADDERGLNTWLKRTCKVDALRFLDRDAAIKAIEGLRAMTRRKKRSTGGDAGTEEPRPDPAA